jgi:DNA mismatch repair protein MutL
MNLRVATAPEGVPVDGACPGVLQALPGGDVSRDASAPQPLGNRVRELPGTLVDQIAAGEVVERPASVVKELVENALDAGARRVRVEVRGGGRDWIAVTDDGCGMSAADARMALRRHATSKIASLDDLKGIRTYGFRGEALPAIASVSRLRLRSRSGDSPAAFELRVEAGEVREERATGAPAGTRVEVADLFAAVPARRKFLKSVNTEWGHIADWLARAALALIDVHFDIRRDDRAALVWPAAHDELDRVAAVIGEAEAAAFVPVAREEGRVSVHGYVSRPDRHRSTTAGIYLFVNNRPVRDRMLQHALVEVYRDMLPRGRFPAAVLFVDLPPGSVDVNVHPAKWEVRFEDPRSLHRLVRHAVRDAVGERRWIAPAAPDAASLARERTADSASGLPGTWDRGGHSAREHAGGRSDWVFALRDATREAGDPGLPSSAPAEPPRLRFGDMRLLGQLLATYLLLEAKDLLLLIDQHAAHERVLYERFRAEWIDRSVASQGLLAPLPVRLAPGPLAALLEAGDSLVRLGFEIEAFGEDTLAVRAVPALLADRDPAGLVRSLADELEAAGSAADALRVESRALEAADRIFATLACHAARRKGEVLDPREQHALLDALDAIPWAPTCPHGRPVAVPIEIAEIERRFGRR